MSTGIIGGPPEEYYTEFSKLDSKLQVHNVHCMWKWTSTNEPNDTLSMLIIAGSELDAPPMLQRNFILRTNKSTNQRTLVSRLIVLRNVRHIFHALSVHLLV